MGDWRVLGGANGRVIRRRGCSGRGMRGGAVVKGGTWDLSG